MQTSLRTRKHRRKRKAQEELIIGTRVGNGRRPVPLGGMPSTNGTGRRPFPPHHTSSGLDRAGACRWLHSGSLSAATSRRRWRRRTLGLTPRRFEISQPARSGIASPSRSIPLRKNLARTTRARVIRRSHPPPELDDPSFGGCELVRIHRAERAVPARSRMKRDHILDLDASSARSTDDAVELADRAEIRLQARSM